MDIGRDELAAGYGERIDLLEVSVPLPANQHALSPYAWRGNALLPIVNYSEFRVERPINHRANLASIVGRFMPRQNQQGSLPLSRAMLAIPAFLSVMCRPAPPPPHLAISLKEPL